MDYLEPILLFTSSKVTLGLTYGSFCHLPTRGEFIRMLTNRLVTLGLEPKPSCRQDVLSSIYTISLTNNHPLCTCYQCVYITFPPSHFIKRTLNAISLMSVSQCLQPLTDCYKQDLTPQPSDYKSDALPVEPLQHLCLHTTVELQYVEPASQIHYST